MISVAEAKKIILENCIPLQPSMQPLLPASGLTIAQDVISGIDIPNYPQSSMDGYAFRYVDLQSFKTFEIKGEMAAGSSNTVKVEPGIAVRIFTGAPVPAGADTVVMQEKTRIRDSKLIIDDTAIEEGSNVRRRGSEIRTGDLALAKGTILTPAAVGFLASLGITSVLTYPLPRISIIATGNELQTPGHPLSFGQVYDSNTSMLQAALHQLNFQQIQVHHVGDKPEALVETLQAAFAESDVVCITGGVSVGDYDFVAVASDQTGVKKVFHGIKQKPGKPFYFGKKGNKLVFGLPGNPASVLTCFYQYLEPALKKLANQRSLVKIVYAPLATPVKKAAGLTHFLKGHYDGNIVNPLAAQESYRLISFARANCLVKISEEATACNAGEIVEVYLLP